MAISIYPVQCNDIFCDDYKVKINGKNVELNTARVSAIPFNRRWPGHQRQIEQTEAISFLSFAADEPVTFEITPREKFERVKIRPASLGLQPEITSTGEIRFTLTKPAYFTVEPYGRQRALHIFADPMPRYNVNSDDEKIIYYGAGIHDVGQIELHEGETLFIDEGAVVYACVTARDVNDIKILGRGILDNSRNKENILFEVNTENNLVDVGNATRQHTIELQYCNNVLIDGITVRDSLVYNIRPIGCRNLQIKNIKIIGCWRYNSDGIDMHNCENVLIENCFIRTFDDAICVKGFDFYYGVEDMEKATHEATYHKGGIYDKFSHVRVRGCVIWNDWGKSFEIGAETKAEEIYDVVFEDCDVIHTMSTVLDCMNVDYADVHDITWRNIRIELDETVPKPKIQLSDSDTYVAGNECYTPNIITTEVVYHPEYSEGGARRGRNRELLFENIHIVGSLKPRFYICGYSENADCKSITIKDIYLNGKKLISPNEYELIIGQFCANIKYVVS